MEGWAGRARHLPGIEGSGSAERQPVPSLILLLTRLALQASPEAGGAQAQPPHARQVVVNLELQQVGDVALVRLPHAVQHSAGLQGGGVVQRWRTACGDGSAQASR